MDTTQKEILLSQLDQEIASILAKRFSYLKNNRFKDKEKNTYEKEVLKNISQKYPRELQDYLSEVFRKIFESGEEIERNQNYTITDDIPLIRRCYLAKEVSHSFSARANELLGRGDYELCEVPDRESFLSVLNNSSFLGYNLGAPYKTSTFPLLDEVSEDALACGAVTCILRSNGKLCGYNPDVDGVKMLFDSVGGIKGKRVMILGSGGASKTVQAVAKNEATAVYIVSRTGEINYSNYMDYDAEIIINTTPVGAYPNENESPIYEFPPHAEAVIDCVYNPLRTTLIQLAEAKGLKYAGGLRMLVKQAAVSNHIWYGDNIGDDEVLDVASRLFAEKSGVALIGMPGSGKTTVGRLLAERLGKKFVDAEETFSAIHKTTPSKYIAKYGEQAYIAAEKEVILDLAKQKEKVIALSDGIIEDLIMPLKRNNICVFLDRSLDKLDLRRRVTAKGDIESEYESRLSDYNKADVKVSNNGGLFETSVTTLKQIKLFLKTLYH